MADALEGWTGPRPVEVSEVQWVTAKATDGEVLDGWRAGAAGYTAKPFRPGELIRYVSNLLTTSPGSSTTAPAEKLCALCGLERPVAEGTSTVVTARRSS